MTKATAAKRVVEYSCIGILTVLYLPLFLFAGGIWLIVAPFAFIYEVGTNGWDRGFANWKEFFLS